MYALIVEVKSLNLFVFYEIFLVDAFKSFTFDNSI